MAVVGKGCVWYQKIVSLKSRSRGCHLVTDEILKAVPEISYVNIGIAHLCIQHTSASLCLNENWDSSVRSDAEMAFNHIVPENLPYKHTLEGRDDMPAHVKTALVGASISVPITGGKFNLGTWQGIWLCEHRNSGGSRNVVVTVQGAPSKE